LTSVCVFDEVVVVAKVDAGCEVERGVHTPYTQPVKKQ